MTPYALLWTAAWASLQWSYLLSLAIAVVAAGFLVRLFMIQHDCGHGSFFRTRSANDWIGRTISVLTFTPYDDWRRSHAAHHASWGISTGAASAISRRSPLRNSSRCLVGGVSPINSTAIRW